MARSPTPKSSPQAELFLEHDDFAERLGREFALILFPVLDKGMPNDRCREVADRLALLASRRARDAGRRAAAPALVPCAGCDVPTTPAGGAVLCAGCAAGIRTAGSDG